jgi:hypothetical protein
MEMIRNNRIGFDAQTQTITAGRNFIDVLFCGKYYSQSTVKNPIH